jgi:endonuclease/exonuclease/phosphatase family metal-dependent hydrolase
MTATPVRGRRFTAARVALFLLAIAALVAWDGYQKKPAGPAEGDQLVGSPPTTAPTDNLLRIATFNINGCVGGNDNRYNLDRTVAALRGADLGGFDLMGLQEVHGESQAASIGEGLHLPHLFAPVESQWWHEDFGNAALTDLPVEYWQRIPLSSNGAYSNRNILLLRARFAGETLNILITHIDRKADRIIELRTVFGLFASLRQPAILMGDFNSPPDTTVTKIDPTLQELIQSPGISDPVGEGYDRIFLRGMSGLRSGHIDNGASDHPLAWTEVKIQ